MDDEAQSHETVRELDSEERQPELEVTETATSLTPPTRERSIVPPAPDRFEKFTESARRVLNYSEREARVLGDRCIGTEHVLLALVRVEEETGGHVLCSFGLDHERVRAEVIVRPRREVPIDPSSEWGISRELKRYIEATVSQARGLRHSYVGTEHLLLALPYAGVDTLKTLQTFGVTSHRLRVQTMWAIRRKRFDAVRRGALSILHGAFSRQTR